MTTSAEKLERAMADNPRQEAGDVIGALRLAAVASADAKVFMRLAVILLGRAPLNEPDEVRPVSLLLDAIREISAELAVKDS